MKRFVMLAAALMLVAIPTQARADGFDRLYRAAILWMFIFPFGMSCLGLGCSLAVSRSGRSFLAGPFLGGLVAAAVVPVLIGADNYWGAFSIAAAVNSIMGLALSLVAWLLLWFARRF